jgi:methyl-accepting chemotaxis protein
MKINRQISLIILISMGIFLLISSVSSYYTLNNLKKEEIEKMRATLLEERKSQLRDVVQNAYSVLETARFYEPAQQAIAGMRFGENKNNYFYIVDPTGMFWVNPAHPELVGKINKDLKDAKGMRYIEQIITESFIRQDGYLQYYENKPGSPQPSIKLVHFKYYKPWNWILCASIFIDDIDAILNSNQADISAAMSSQIKHFIIIGILGMGLAAFLSMLFFRKQLVQPIQKLTEAVEKMIQGDFSASINIKSNREINQLVDAVERMQNSFAVAYRRLKAHTEMAKKINEKEEEILASDARAQAKTRFVLKTVGE